MIHTTTSIQSARFATGAMRARALGCALGWLCLVLGACGNAPRDGASAPGAAGGSPANSANAAGRAPDGRAGGPGSGPGRGGSAQDIPVVLATASEQNFTSAIEAVGTAMAREAVEITSKVSNTVSRIAFEEDQPVQRGQLLVELDPAEANAELAGAEAALAESKRQFARSRDLAARRLLSDAELDQIDATLKAAEARVAAARARRANSTIRAPFSGRTGFRRISVGSLVSPGTVITTLDDTSIIKLEFTIPESQMFLVERGILVKARTVGLPGRVFEGRLSVMDARVDPVSRSIRVRAELPNADGALKPGMFMNVAIEGRSATAIVVPEATIVPEQGKTYVYVVGDDAHARRREVQIGRRRIGEVEIVDGLESGEQIVREGTQSVRDGSRVTVIDADPPAAVPAASPSPVRTETQARADR